MSFHRGHPVVVVGAGPYGLSVAAHLAHAGVATRVFGHAMETWATGMPRGMFLKSAPMASDLSDPDRSFTLAHYCRERGIGYHSIDMPLPVEMFTDYGRAFQRRFVPHLEEKRVTRLSRGPDGFALSLDDGSSVEASDVVLATGLRSFGASPTPLAGLPTDRVSHSSAAGDLPHMQGCDVVVIGSGSSAVDVAAALHRSGARATLLARRTALRFPPRSTGRRRWYHELRAPMTPLGPGWNKVLACNGPHLFRRLPPAVRVSMVHRYLGPSPTLSVKETVENHVPLILGAELTAARILGGRVRLFYTQGGAERSIDAEHVVAATGYEVRLDRLQFIDPALLGEVETTAGYPQLSASFMSSVRGLYIVGAPSAVEFGPLLRFVAGACFCAKRVTRAISASRRERPGAFGRERSISVAASTAGEPRELA